MNYKIAILAGDGIGPEVMKQAIKALDAVAAKFNHQFVYRNALIGGAAWPEYGQHFPKETEAICKQSDAILFGSVGGPVEDQDKPQWKDAERNAILGVRKTFNLAINLRPARVLPSLAHISPLKTSILEKGVDLLIVRELIGDIYFGKHETLPWKQASDGRWKMKAADTMEYNEDQIATALNFAFKSAQARRGKLTVVDKANVLDCSRLWRTVTEGLKPSFPDVTVDYMFIDNAVQQVIKNPSQFDVIATGNMFGDILSDACAVLPGSLGLMPSASLAGSANSDQSNTKCQFGMYEPIGGSAPRHAGKNTCNPIAQILSAALMLRYSFNLEKEAKAIEEAVIQTLAAGILTRDLIKPDQTPVGTEEMGDLIAERISQLA